MTDAVERSAEWVYRGIWVVLANCFKVPQQPPSMPVEPGGFHRKFHPSRRYLAYLKLYFWVALVVIDIAILIGWLAVLFWQPLIGWLIAVPVFVVAVVPDIIAYIAIHLRYDTMWYVITDRSLRVRRGIWVIAEHTITFENVQNVDLHRGPVQQLFGISTLVVETAGASEDEGEHLFSIGNKAIMQGIDNPEEIRDLIMNRVRSTRSAGLGDEPQPNVACGWSPRALQLLREIRDEARELG